MRIKASHAIIVAISYLPSMAFVVASQSNKLEPSPGVGITERMTTKWIDRKVLENYRQGDFAVMALDNPLLAGAYLHVASHMGSHIIRGNPPRDDFEWAAYEDLKRRGDGVALLLLRLCAENQYSTAEGQIISMVSYTPEINSEPFLEYIRKAIMERGQLLGSDNCSYFGYFLARFGTPSDTALLKKWGQDRPYVAADMDALIRRAAIDRGDAIIPELPLRKHSEENQAGDSVEKAPSSSSSNGWWLPVLLSCLALVLSLIILSLRAKLKRSR